MNNKFNSLMEESNDNNYYNINNKDNILFLTRVVNQSLILNYKEDDIKMQKKYEKNNFSDPQSIILSGRPCSSLPCNKYKKFCCSKGEPSIINKIENFSPIYNSNFVDQYLYSKNIDFESNLKNIDYRDNICKNNSKKNHTNFKCKEQNFVFFKPTKRINSAW